MSKVEAGSDIDAWCGKCKLILAHVVIAMKGTKAARTQCKTCNSAHAYRASIPGSSKAKGTKRTRTTPAQDLDTMLEGRDISAAPKYALKESFEPDAVMDHKKFGIGMVIRQISGGKIEVMFKDGPRVLVHGRV